MKYVGKVYAKINGKYIECTETTEALENNIKNLQEELEKYKDLYYRDSSKLDILAEKYDKLKQAADCIASILKSVSKCSDIVGMESIADEADML